MPLIHIYLNEGKSAEYRSAVSDALHQAFLETWNIPLKDRFHIFHETKPGDLQIDKEMWDVERSDDNIVFHVFTSPRTTAMKLAFYQRLPQLLEEKVGLRPDDVFVSLAQNTREDWSFGKGAAQLLATQGQTSPEALAVPSSATSRAVGSVGRRSLSTLAGSRALNSLVTSTRRVGGGRAGAVVGKLGLVAACSASAFLGRALTDSK
jgi:phenylpyruvate tautomerase PptA (4-oxalocrotonate tautomerase family)